MAAVLAGADPHSRWRPHPRRPCLARRGAWARLRGPARGATTHAGFRDKTQNPPTGYWIWSQEGLTKPEIDKCRVSNNPPVHQWAALQGHGLDAQLGLGTVNDEQDALGFHATFSYLDGTSVRGAPGFNASA